MRYIISLLLCLVVYTSAQEPAAPKLKESPFPLYGTVLKLDKHELGLIAAYITFYNESKQDIKGFTGLCTFTKGNEVILQVMLKVEKDMISEENTAWWGAIPYDYSNEKESSLIDENPNEIEMHIEVKAIVTASGYEKVYSAD